MKTLSTLRFSTINPLTGEAGYKYFRKVIDWTIEYGVLYVLTEDKKRTAIVLRKGDIVEETEIG